MSCHVMPSCTQVDPAYYLYALNATIVGLCVSSERISTSPDDTQHDSDTPLACLPAPAGLRIPITTPTCACIGLGIIRSIDVERRLFYLLTPVAPALLERCDVMLKGPMELTATFLSLQQVRQRRSMGCDHFMQHISYHMLHARVCHMRCAPRGDVHVV